MKCLLTLFLLLAFALPGAPTETKNPEKQLEQIQEQLQESKQELKKTKKEEQAVLGRLTVIKKELTRTQHSLYQAQKKIEANETQVSVLNSEIKQRAEDLKSKEEKLNNRLREVYKSSGLNYLELLISSRSMADFFNRLYFFRKIIEYDSQFVQGVRADLHQIKQKKELLSDKTTKIKELAQVIAGKKKEISSKAEEKESLYAALQRRRKEYEARVAELEKSSQELEVLILKATAGRRGEAVRGSGALEWPLQGRITSQFGYRRHPFWGGRHFHTGLDIANKYGTPVKAADAGEVIFSGWWDGYGKAIVVDHGRETTTVYAHLSRIYKSVGAIVAKGQILGLVGSTGYSTGPHLHFEIRKKGKPVNPMSFLK